MLHRSKILTISIIIILIALIGLAGIIGFNTWQNQQLAQRYYVLANQQLNNILPSDYQLTSVNLKDDLGDSNYTFQYSLSSADVSQLQAKLAPLSSWFRSGDTYKTSKQITDDRGQHSTWLKISLTGQTLSINVAMD